MRRRTLDAATRHEPEEARTSEVSATSAEDPRAGRQSKREQEKEKRQVKRDRRAVREAFSVIDDDGGGSVEAPEVLKALRALGKQVDDKSFWTKFQKMCGDGPMFLDREKFETMMLELLARKQRWCGHFQPAAVRLVVMSARLREAAAPARVAAGRQRGGASGDATRRRRGAHGG